MKKLVSVCAAIAAVMTMLSVQAEFAYEFTATVNYQGAETLVDFPVLVRLPGLVTSRMRADGLDIRFFTEDGETELAHDFEKFAYRDLSLVWVKVPSLSVGTKLVVRFGDPDFDTPAAGTSTWSSYVGVWHLDDYKNTSVPDASGRSTGSGNSTCRRCDGKLLTAVQPTDSTTGWDRSSDGYKNHKITIGNKGALATDGKLTLTWWMKPNNGLSGAMPRTLNESIYLFWLQKTSKVPLWTVRYLQTGDLAPTFDFTTYQAAGASPTAVSVPNADIKINQPDWIHLACTIEDSDDHAAATGAIYANTVKIAQAEDLNPLLSAGTSGNFYIGGADEGWHYCGALDEVRVRAVVSSSDWLQAERDSVNNPEFVQMPADLPEIIPSVTRRIVATEEEKEGDWADAAVAGDDAAAVIQSVIDASAFGDTVLLKAGTYVLTSELSLANVTHNGVRLRSDDGAGNLARETTLLVGGYPATQNRLIKCAAQTVTVEGFTFTNGYVDATCGGAIWLDKVDAGTRILNCDFLGNTAWWAAKETASSSPGSDCVEGAGGAVFIEGAGIISNCLFRGNRGFSGAGVQSKSALKVVSPVMDVPSVTRCSFTENSTHGPGNAGPKYGSGAGICAYGAAVVDHSTFVSNHAFSARGDGIACSGNEGLSVSNCTFEGNSCIYRSTGAYIPKAVLLASKSVSCTMIGENPDRCPRLISGDVLDGHTYSNCSFTAGSDIYRMRNCLFIDNNVASGIIMNGSAGQNSYIDNCTFIRNTSCFRSENGDARTNFVNNCVFFGNAAIHTAKDDNNAKGANFVMTNCVYSGKFTDRPNGLPTPVEEGCRTDLTPQTAKFFAVGRGDLHLRADSPLQGAGVTLDWMDGALDRDGKPRVVGGAPDIGCYERQEGTIDPPDNLCTRAVATEADKTGDWKDAIVGIQAAVDAAYDYEPLYVRAGTYALTAPVTVKNKAISFIGEGKDTTILDGQGASRCLVAILDSNAAGDLTFDGFTFTNGCAGADTSAGNYNARGGCVYLSCAESFRRITLSDCRVTGGRSLQPLTDAGKVPDKKNFRGAGAYAVQYCAFTGCVFDDNIASNTEASAVGIESIGTAGVRGSGTIFTDCIVTNCQNIGEGSSGGSFCAGIQDWGSGCAWIENTTFADLTGNKYYIALNLKGGATITNCVFRDCEASSFAIAAGGSTSRLSGCRIERCTGNSIVDGLPAVDRCVFCNNSGTIWFKTSPVDVHNSLFMSNTAAIISTHDTSDKRGLFENCTFVDNNGDNSSVVSVQGAKTNNKFTFVNCILWGNTKDVNCTDKKWQDTDLIAYTNCLVEAYTTALPETHEGCIEGLSPRFVDPANGNYRLKHNSPLRDKGLTLDWMTAEAADLDGKPRRLDKRGKPTAEALPDIGCYECDLPKPGLLLLVR